MPLWLVNIPHATAPAFVIRSCQLYLLPIVHLNASAAVSDRRAVQ